MAVAVGERRWWVLGVGLLTTLLVIVGGSIPTLAVPAMARGLGTGLGGAELALAAYPLAFAVLPVAGAPVGRIAGRRAVATGGLALFAAGMLGAALAPTIAVLVAARLLQGLGAALVYGQVLHAVRPSFRGDERRLALGVIGVTGGLGIAAGQLVGGALTTLDPFGLGWRSMFLLLLVLGVAATAGAAVLLPADPRRPPRKREEERDEGPGEEREGDAAPTRLGAGGLVALLPAVALVAVPLLLGQDEGWPPWVLLPLIAAPPALVGLARIERRPAGDGGARPPGRLFWRQPGFTLGAAIAILLAAGQAGVTLATVLALELGRGVAPVAAGLVCLPMGLAVVAAVPLAPWAAARLGRHALTLGACLCGAGELILLAVAHVVGQGVSLWALVPGLVVAGAGQGLAVASLLECVRGSVRRPFRRTASSAIAFCLQVGQAMGLAASGMALALASDLALGRGGEGRYLTAYQAALAVLAVLASIAVALVLVLPRAPEEDPAEEEEPPRLAGIVGSVLLLTGAQVGDGWLERGGDGPGRRPGLLKEAPQEPGDFLVRYFRNELSDVGWYRSLADEARALGPSASAPESSRDAVMRQQIADIRQHQRRGLVPAELDPAALQLMVVALAAAPHLLPQITRMTTGYDPDTPQFRGIWGRFLRQLGESLTHPPDADGEGTRPPPPPEL